MSDVEEDIDPNGSFAYDVAVCYEDDNDDEGKAEIQGVIDKLEQDDWGFLVYDSHRDGEGSVVKRLEKSVDDCRHAIVFLSQKLLEAIKRNVEAPSVTNMETFLCNILQSQDTRLKRKLIVVRLRMECPNVKIPAYLSSYRILNTGEKGFNRQLYKALSKLPGPQTITSMQIRKKVDRIGRSCTEGILAEVAKELEIPEGVLDNIKQEFGGHKRQLMEVLEVWRVHRGPEATLAVADDVIMKTTNTPQQVETTAPQSLGTLFPDVDETTDCIGNLDLAPKDSMDEKLKEEEKQLSSLPSVPTHAVNGGKKKTSRKDRGQPLSTDI
ncbi:Hypp8009 [Branchiostoma lanceolatum]|uniref:Hypp8009 protein n=1 Tax=Branchiostoma lanceolatum TaxID=7740 RepID=A0A8K0EDJ1_BRALA|nr:Hypp8009 [Branchiostoma lanceolatum]